MVRSAFKATHKMKMYSVLNRKEYDNYPTSCNICAGFVRPLDGWLIKLKHSPGYYEDEFKLVCLCNSCYDLMDN